MSEASQELQPVTIHILDKEYRIACQDGEQESLLASAQLVDERMRTTRQTGKVIGSERIAVLVALNLAHELLTQRRENELGDTSRQRIRALQEKIELALDSSNPA